MIQLLDAANLLFLRLEKNDTKISVDYKLFYGLTLPGKPNFGCLGVTTGLIKKYDILDSPYYRIC